jgi:tetratricopeptide (TPR) repeat protein
MSRFGKITSRIGILLVLAATYFVYAPITAFTFVYDDIFQVVQNPRIDSWKQLPGYFTQHFWAHVPGTPANLYRPLVLVWFLINNSIFSHEPSGWHLTTLLVHLTATGLVFLMSRKLLQKLVSALAVTAIFALHPIHVEPVAWISAVTEPLCAVWFLAAFLCYLKSRESGPKNSWLLASLGCYAAALLTKETAAALPVLIVAYELLYRGSTKIYPALRTSLRSSWPYFGVFITYLALRLEILHGLAHRASTVSPRDALLTLPWALWFYVRKSVWPSEMSPMYDIHYASNVRSLTFLVPALLLALAAVAVIWICMRRMFEKPVLALTWFVLTLAPALAAFVAAPKYEGLTDRYLYLPSVAVCLLVGFALEASARRLWIQRTAWACIVLALVAAPFSVRRQTRVWENNYTLFERAVNIAPGNVTAAVNFGVELQRRERYNEALALAQNSLMSEPDSVNLLSLAGAAAFQLHRFDLAEQYYEEGTRVRPMRGDLYQCLAMSQIQLARYHDAASSLQQGIAVSPERPGLHYTLGKVLSWNQDWTSARDQFRLEVALDPQNSAARLALEQAQNHLQFAAMPKR